MIAFCGQKTGLVEEGRAMVALYLDFRLSTLFPVTSSWTMW